MAFLVVTTALISTASRKAVFPRGGMTYPLVDMTCIVGAIDGQTVILGSDSAAVGDPDGSEIYTMPQPKVFSCGRYVVGVCGSYRVAQVLRYRAELPEPSGSRDLEAFVIRDVAPAIGELLAAEGVVGSHRTFLGDKVALLVGFQGQLWCIAPDLSVLPEGEFGAIGSGRLRAYAALHALKSAGIEPARRRLELALEAAAKYTSSVRPPWHFVRSGA